MRKVFSNINVIGMFGGYFFNWYPTNVFIIAISTEKWEIRQIMEGLLFIQLLFILLNRSLLSNKRLNP